MLLVCGTLLEEGNNHNVLISKDPVFGNSSEKTSDLYPIRPDPAGQHVDVVLERWKGNTESIFLFVRVVFTCAPIL